MLKDFKEFALRGNVIDMAVGIIIGAAFSKIVSSLVNDVIMPPMGMLLGRVDFSKFSLVIQQKTAEHAGITIKYGQFLNNIINFIILAFVIFIIVRQANRLKQKTATALSVKNCPECISTINIQAKRCPACTAKIA